MRPNIFDIAPKELNQDAFITWLLSWADPSNKQYDDKLYLCGQQFIKVLIASQHETGIGEIKNVEAGRQWENIDVWAEVYTTLDNYLIIIEDKTFSSERADQLITYKATGEAYCIENDLKLVCVYLKTGNEPKKVLNSIMAKGFATFRRREFIGLLVGHEEITNDIYKDFVNRLKSLEAAYNAFEHTPLGKWDSSCWIGFYEFLENELVLVDWQYVNPPGGDGFWNAVLNWEDWDGFPVYIQIEQGKLCFKITVHPEEIDFEGEFDASRKRNDLFGILDRKAKELGYEEIRRPDRFGFGSAMTSALVYQEDWLGASDAIIDKPAVIERLKKYKQFLLASLGANGQ